MARKRKRRGDAAATEAPVEVAEQEAPAAAKTGRPRGGDATAEHEASAAVHAHGPADSGKETTDGEGKKPKRRKKKKKKNMQQPSPSAVSDGNAVELDKSTTDCKDVPGDDETIRSPRNEEDPGFSAEQDIPERKKPRRKKRKNNKQEQSPSAVTDGDTVVVGTSGNDCTHGKGVPGVADVTMSSRNGEDQDCPEVNIAEKGAPERKKPKRRQKKKNMQQPSPSAVSNGNAVELDKSRTDCKDVPGDDETIRSPRNEEDPGFSAEQDIPERKKPRRKKRKNNKQEQSPSAVTDGDAIVVGTSGNDCTHGKGVPRVADVTMSSRNGEDQDCPEVNIAEKGAPERKKPKRRKKSTATVSDDGAVLLHKSENDCIDGDDASGDAQVSVSTTNVEDPYCPEVNIAENGTNERKKPKPKKRKNKKEGSSSVILDAGAGVADESRNSCKDGDGAPPDIEASICPPNGEDSVCPAVNNAEKGIPEMNKPKRKKQKKNNQQPSPSAVLDATDVVMDKSGHGSTNVGAPSGASDVTISPRIGEGPEYTKLNSTDDFLEENKVNKDYSQKSKLKKQMKNKHEQSPSALLDTCAAVEDKSGNSYVDGKGSLGATDISTSPRTGKDHDCPEVNIANDLVEVKNGNDNNSQKPKSRKRKRKKMAPVAVTETPPVGGVSSDERKDAFETGSMKATAKSTIISMTSTSGENYKENVRDIYSPEGSLVRFQRKKLLILDINGILADINTDRNVAHMADGRVRGKNVFKRYYLDDFLRFCFQNFELGIWSSRMKVNVDAVLDILMKDLRRHLLFFWDASQCTTTNRGTLENRYKPLVLKELKKLWNKEDPDLPWEQGEFSPSNTLLVDDSPYKALRNPPHTAIFPQPYSYHMEEDESLGPGGDLRVYLENIAAADDVQRYVQEHPFGQPSITESHPHWNFYAKIRCTG